MNQMDFYESFNFLKNHRSFAGNLLGCLNISVVKVNPNTKRIEDDGSQNSKTQVWLECVPYNDGPYQPRWIQDQGLSCGGDTFEEAIICLAKLVLEKDSMQKDCCLN